MKSKLSLAILILALSPAPCALSQIPQGFNYQAIARDGSGNPIVNTSLPVRITIQADSLGTSLIWQELHSSITTNSFGLITLVLGRGARQATSNVATFSAIDWSVYPKFVKTEINYGGWKTMGVSRLWSIPFAMAAGELAGPVDKLGIVGTTSLNDEALFEVRNKNGQTVFAVYNEGVRVYVSDGNKGLKGGFAVGGFGTDKAGESTKYLVVSKDSVRIYLDTNPLTKPAKGGFAVGGFDLTKAGNEEYLRVTRDSTRVYVKEPQKGTKGGFAVGGFDLTKANTGNYLNLTTSNYFIGQHAGYSNTTGLFNSFMGYYSGYSNKTGSYNTFMGYEAGYLTDASWNTMVGYKAGRSNTTGQMNLFIGYGAGESNTWGLQNVFVGYLSGNYNQSGYRNTFIGNNSGYGVNTGADNIMVGSNAGNWFRKGDNNIFIGKSAGYATKFNTDSAYNNIFIGSNAGRLITVGGENVFIGSNSGYSISSGSFNVFTGFETGYSNTSGNNNVFLGYQTGRSNTSGYKNTIIGFSAGYSNTTGWSNTFIGNMAGNANISGAGNIFIGPSAGLVSKGDGNLFIGLEAGYSNTTGALNVVLGNAAGHANTTAFFNTFLGTQAGYSTTTGGSNLYIGMNAGGLNVSGSNNVFLGSQAGYNETGSNRLYISNTSGDKNNALIYGEFDTRLLTVNGNLGIGKTSPAAKLDITGGNWNVAGGEGDFRIGDGTYRFKIGVANSGGGAGDVRLNAHGGTNRLIFGGGGNDVLQVTSSDVLPWATNTSSLGSSALKWTVVYATNGTIQTSDARLKENISELGYGLESLLKLKPVSFTWKNDNNGKEHLGLLAQDVEKVINEVVDKGSDPSQTLGINYSELVPVLIKSIQEQQKQIDELKAMVEKLSSEK
jgi:hypothetical protein